MKILVISPKEFVGVSAVFDNGYKLGLWDFVYLQDLDTKKLSEYEHIIFGAYHPEYEKLFPLVKCKKSILITSSIGQVEQANEQQLLERIIYLAHKNIIDEVYFGSKDFYDCFKTIIKNSNHFPYPIHILEIKQSLIKSKKNIGLFAPNHFRKNIFNQIFACRKIGIDNRFNIKLHTNIPIKVTGLDIVNYNWLPKEDYHKLLSEMWVALSCFHTESFAYSVVESILNGTIPIISPCIRDNFNLPKEIMVINIDSVTAISDRLNEIIKLEDILYQSLLSKCQNNIIEISNSNNNNLKKLLEKS